MPGDDPGGTEERWLEAAFLHSLIIFNSISTIIPIDTIEGCMDARERKGPKKKKRQNVGVAIQNSDGVFA
jgi:hypothetical protein